MINADEHKKLLAQIEELERDSTNFFDVEKEFFLIDSDNLAEVKTRFYGYSIQATGIYEQDNMTSEAVANLDGRGCYVYVEAHDGQITVKQDLNGSWGLYLFRHGDYFALSNSFFRLLDHVKLHYLLTVNRDYCHYLLADNMLSHACSWTAVNEIRLVERNAVFNIDVAKKSLQIKLIDYKENTVLLDSEEGITILDHWVEFWGNVLRGILQHTKFMEADLSGGFDSRISFLLALYSGINCNEIKINTFNSTASTFAEDYGIASKIVAHYGFKLNRSLPTVHFLNYSFSDTFNLNTYHRQTIHKIHELNFNTKSVEKRYKLSGYSGETLRGYWHVSPKEFMEKQFLKAKPYSSRLNCEISSSIKRILESGFSFVRDKYKIEDTNSENIPQYIYQEARARNHYGKISLGRYFSNIITLSPALDPIIRTVQLAAPDCPDPKLLMALLFTRYEPKLLTIPFDHKRSIAPETVEYARKLNERFPICHKKVDNLTGGGQAFHLQPRDLQAEKILASGLNNPIVPQQLLMDSLKAGFYSRKTRGLFCSCFDDELYNYAANQIETLGNTAYAYSVVGIAKVLQDVEISNANRPLYQDMQQLLWNDFCRIHNDAQIVQRFKRYFTALVILILNRKKDSEDFQILSVSDVNAKISESEWWQQFGVCHVVKSYVGKLEVVVKVSVDGNVRIMLSAPLVLDDQDQSKRVPYWIDYTRLVINGETLFDAVTPAWHNKPYSYSLNVKAGEEVTVQVEWLPHRSDT